MNEYSYHLKWKSFLGKKNSNNASHESLLDKKKKKKIKNNCVGFNRGMKENK